MAKRPKPIPVDWDALKPFLPPYKHPIEPKPGEWKPSCAAGLRSEGGE